jgi:hypothetical protein
LELAGAKPLYHGFLGLGGIIAIVRYRNGLWHGVCRSRKSRSTHSVSLLSAMGIRLNTRNARIRTAFASVVVIHLFCSLEIAAQNPDTAAMVMRIEQRMAQVDQAPVGAVFLSYSDRENAVLLRPDSTVTGDPVERNEIYLNPDGSVAGVGTFLRSTYPGITESACHYFDPDGHTVAVSWTMKWLHSVCTDSVAVQTTYVYFGATGASIQEFATLTDQQGKLLDHTTCMYPNLDRHFDAFYHRDILLMSKHITLR